MKTLSSRLLSVIAGSGGICTALLFTAWCGCGGVLLSKLKANHSWRMWLPGFLSGWSNANLIACLLVISDKLCSEAPTSLWWNLLSGIFSTRQRSDIMCITVCALCLKAFRFCTFLEPSEVFAGACFFYVLFKYILIWLQVEPSALPWEKHKLCTYVNYVWIIHIYFCLGCMFALLSRVSGCE